MSNKKLANGVWVGDKFYAAGSTPPSDVAEQITNPRAWSDDRVDEQVSVVVGAPTPEQVAAAEAEAAKLGTDGGDGTTSADAAAVQDPDAGKTPAPAKRAAAKKATAKKAAPSSS